MIAGVTSGSKMVAKYQLLTAQNLTKNSPIAGIKDLAVWYETSLTSSFDSSQASDATAISKWLGNNPQSALKNDLTQGTAAAQPKFYENVFGVIPSVRFDGTDDFLNFNGTLMVNWQSFS